MKSRRPSSPKAGCRKRTCGSLHPAGCAALTEYIERKKREARRRWPMTRVSGPTWRELNSYWEGQYVALVKLQKRFERIVKAQHNDGTQRPGTPDGSLATETRKPGSLK